MLRQSSNAWSDPIKIAGQSGVDFFDYTGVRFNSQGQIFVVYKEGTRIHLSKYDGKSISFMKDVSESSLLCYAPYMLINSRDEIHIIWAECSEYNSNTQYIKYRYFNGSWSPVITIITLDISGNLPGGYISRKIDSMRMGMDSKKNMFIVYQANPETRSWFVSRYGTQVILERWLVTEKNKLPDVAVDDSFIHVVWQAKLSIDGYTIKYAKKTNALNGKWFTPIDVKNNENINDSAHAPRITLDSNYTPHVIYMNDSPTGGGRNTFYCYLAGSRFSEPFLVTENAPAAYANLGISISNSIDNMVIINSIPPASRIMYNWKVNGQWTGNEEIRPLVGKPDNEAVDLSRDGKVAAVSCTSAGEAVYLILSEGNGPVPPPPPFNLPPEARFTLSPLSGIYPLNVTFNASASSDSDGKIVSYRWNFGDGAKGSGVRIGHIYQMKNTFRITLTVTDNDGAIDTAAGEIEVLGVSPPLNVQYVRHENRNLFSIEYMYRITWKDNPVNEEVGATIIAYKIYRRETGQSGYTFFYSMPVNAQGSYEHLDRTLGLVARQYEYAISSLDNVGRESDMN